MLTALLIALVWGIIAYIIAKIVPFTTAFAELIGLVVAILVFVGGGSWR